MNSLNASPDSLLIQYQLCLEALNRSPKTINWYLEILHRFFRFLEENGYSTSVKDIDRNQVREYIKYLQNADRWPNRPKNGKDPGKLSPHSVQGHVRAIKAFWGWLATEEYIERNPLMKFPLPKVPQYVTKTLTHEHITILLSAIDKNSALGARYYSIILILLDTGMRILELVEIKIADLDIRNGLVTILGKGKKQRVVPLSRTTVKELTRYIYNFRQEHDTTESFYLFPDSNGGHISVGGVQQYIRRLAKKAGFKDIKCSPHIFRHTFGTNAAARGANAFTIKEIMGHSSLQTTMKYIHLQTSDIKVQHNMFSIVNDLFKKK